MAYTVMISWAHRDQWNEDFQFMADLYSGCQGKRIKQQR